MARIDADFGGNLKSLLLKTRVLKINFLNSRQKLYQFLPFLIACIIFFSKSLGSAQTVKFWPRTSSQSATRDLHDYGNYPRGKLPEFYATGSGHNPCPD